MIKIVTKTPQELTYLGERLAAFLQAGDLIALDGDLGAGKTTLSQGIAAGLGVTDLVSSPTFTLIHEYTTGRLPFYHFDVYRLNKPEEVEELGYEEYFYGEGVTVVEWAELIKDYLPESYLHLVIHAVPEGREIGLIAMGQRYEKLVGELTGCDYSKYR